MICSSLWYLEQGGVSGRFRRNKVVQIAHGLEPQPSRFESSVEKKKNRNKDLGVTTKVWPNHLRAPGIYGRNTCYNWWPTSGFESQTDKRKELQIVCSCEAAKVQNPESENPTFLFFENFVNLSMKVTTVHFTSICDLFYFESILSEWL